MKNRRWMIPVLIVLFVASLPGVALADLWINGQGNLQTWDTNRCRANGRQGIRCPLEVGQSTTVTMRDQQRKLGCAFEVARRGNIFKDRWDIENWHGPEGNIKRAECKIRWVGSNTAEVSLP